MSIVGKGTHRSGSGATGTIRKPNPTGGIHVKRVDATPSVVEESRSFTTWLREHATLLTGGLVAGLLILLYHQVMFRLGSDWYVDPDYSHGFLVPLMSAYFAWERRDVLWQLPVRPSLWGAALMFLGLSALVLGSVGAELYLQRSSIVLVLAGLILLLLGREHFRLLAFPVAFLFFMIPLPSIVMNAVAFPLQLFAARVAAFCLYSFSIPVLREGNIIMLSGTTLEVAEACSGIRSLQALLTLGTVYAYFSQTLIWKRWTLVLPSIPIAIAANVIRVSGTGFLSEYWGPEAAQGFYHTFEGWLVFLVAFTLLLGCGALISRIGNNSKQTTRAAGTARK